MAGAETLGANEVYTRLKALVSVKTVDQADEMCMDMNEYLLQMARTFNAGSESTERTKSNIYLLASIFRCLAHELHHPKEGVSNKRFLELASCNPGATIYERK